MISSLYAKSARPGRAAELLTDHLVATHHAALNLRQRLGTIAAVDAVAGGFWPAIELAALSHDLGKVADGFQDMLTGKSRSWGHRHELVSLGFLPALIGGGEQRLWVGSAVVTHHRPLTNPPNALSGTTIAALYQEMDPDELRDELGRIDDDAVRDLHAWMVATLAGTGLVTQPPDMAAPSSGADLVARARDQLDHIRAWWQAPTDRATGLAAVLAQGALTLADHLSSAHGTLHSQQPIDTDLATRIAGQFEPTGGIHPHQRRCGTVDGHLLLRSPTGSGKTEAGLLWAAGQVAVITAQAGGVPRVFVTLPYLASINAMAARLGELVNGEDLIGVAHSRAASYHLAKATGTDDGAETNAGQPTRQAADKAVSRDAATRLFRETVRVATPYQLLRAALAGPAHSSLLIDLANSVIVLDELHAYDATRLGYILASARLWERLGCRVAVLSATLPTALAELVEETLHGPVTTVTGPAGRPRHRIRLREHALTDAASIAEITAALDADRSVLVVANNVAHAQTLFDHLAPVARDRHGRDAATLLHSRFKRRDRNTIEQRLIERYGTHARPRRPGLVVATQVVEVSLDLDLDILYTAGAPLEALLQRFGRVNRRGHRPPADVVICPPGYGARRGDASGRLYADGVYEAEPVTHGLAILARHDGHAVDETQATGWLDEVYASPWGNRWRTETTRARNAFDREFLTFTHPFQNREALEDRFDQLFDGTEAILASDRVAYADRLGTAPRAADRLLGEEYLIPLPDWATGIASYDKRLRVRIVDGDYDAERGLLAVRPVHGVPVYQPGEVL